MKSLWFLVLWMALSCPVLAASVPYRWLEGPRGYEKALDTQKETKTPILIWTTWHESPACSRIDAYLYDREAKRELRDYLRVVIDEHGVKKDVEFAKEKNFSAGYFYIIAPGSEKPVAKIWAWKNDNHEPYPNLLEILLKKLKAAGQL